jgi:PAS domain S-box-containing protein
MQNREQNSGFTFNFWDQLNIFEMLFERMPMGVAILDREFRIQRYNPIWKEFSERYGPPAGAPLAPGVGYFEHIPGSEPTILSMFERTLAGETVRQDSLRLEAGGIVSYWDVVLSPLVEEGQISGLLAVSIDATDRVQTQQALQENQRTLSTLISNLPGMAYRCKNDENWTMEFVSEGSLALTGYPPEALVANRKISYGDVIHPQDREKVHQDIQTALGKERPFQISYRIQTPEGLKWVWEQGQAVIDPNGDVIALEGFITDITERVMAQQNLEQIVDERTRELASLLDISSSLGSILDLEQLLDLILDQLGSVLAYDAASIMILEGELLKILAYRGPIEREQALQIQFSVQDARANREVIQQRQPVIIPDIHAPDALASAIREVAGDALETTYGYLRCWMGVPLIVRDRVVGMLTLDHRDLDHYQSSHAELALTFANQAAVAIENARLYQETERRAEESETLFTVQQAITSKLEMDDTLQMISDEARRLTGADISAVYLLEGGALVIAYVSGEVPDKIRGYRLDLNDSIAGRVIQSGQRIQIPDTWDDPRVDREAADQVQARSLLIVPLISGLETIGTITVANRKPGEFSSEDEQLLTKLAANVVISLENARLYQAEHDRREVAESMRAILAVLNSSQSLPETLNYIAKRANQVMESQACLIHRIDYERNFVLIEASHGLPQDLQSIQGFPLHSSARADDQILNRKPVWITDFKKQPQPTEAEQAALHPDVRAWRTLTNRFYQAWIAVPLVIGEHVYGSLAFYFQYPQEVNTEKLKLAAAFADQAALAIENARLYQAAEDAAIASERNRLARDLHDAVTQTLFSASMIADVLPKIWDRSPDEGHRRLEELRQLTRGALSEMRTLLVELRPAALIDTDLGDLIGHQVNAFNARTRVPVEFERNCAQNPPPEIKEAFYRIAQEAFNNIAKHAEAEAVRVQLNARAGQTELEIQDDGLGFDLNSARIEGLGLGIMSERAANVGAKLDIYSRVGKGSRLKITWQESKNEENNDD